MLPWTNIGLTHIRIVSEGALLQSKVLCKRLVMLVSNRSVTVSPHAHVYVAC